MPDKKEKKKKKEALTLSHKKHAKCSSIQKKKKGERNINTTGNI